MWSIKMDALTLHIIFDFESPSVFTENTVDPQEIKLDWKKKRTLL